MRSPVTQRYVMFEIGVTRGMLVEQKKHAIVPLAWVKICYLPTLLQHFTKLVNKFLSRVTSTVSPQNCNVHINLSIRVNFYFATIVDVVVSP